MTDSNKNAALASKIADYLNNNPTADFPALAQKFNLNAARDFAFLSSDEFKTAFAQQSVSVITYKGRNGSVQVEINSGDGGDLQDGTYHYNSKGVLDKGAFQPLEMYQVGLINTPGESFDYRGSGSSWKEDLPGPSRERMLEILEKNIGRDKLTKENIDNYRFLYTESGNNIAVYYVGNKEEAKEHKLDGFGEPRNTDKIPQKLNGFNLKENQKEIDRFKEDLKDSPAGYKPSVPEDAIDSVKFYDSLPGKSDGRTAQAFGISAKELVAASKGLEQMQGFGIA